MAVNDLNFLNPELWSRLFELQSHPIELGKKPAKSPQEVQRFLTDWMHWVKGDRSPFPEGQTGQKPGSNGLFRPNYFNGRFLTAETLRSEQIYWDTRTRLVAQEARAGIVWGLELALPSNLYTRTGGTDDSGLLRQHVETERREIVARRREAIAIPIGDTPATIIELDFRRLCEHYYQKMQVLSKLADPTEGVEELHNDLRRYLNSASDDPRRGTPVPSFDEFVTHCLCKGFKTQLESIEDPAQQQKLEEEMRPVLELALAEVHLSYEEFKANCFGLPPEPEPGPPGGIPLDETVRLSPGLAFDDVGRPIVVGADFPFAFRDLINRYKKEPVRVTGGGTAFAPCICLEPVPGGPIDAGAALPPGPYLLVISPAENQEGEAKVYGELCTPAERVHCQFDGWRGGFGLSLVAYPARITGRNLTPWDYRGLLAAHYFDHYERDLAARWPASFAHDGGFCRGPDTRPREAGAVPLAMVYVGAEGSVLFVDPWIPRRPRASSASSAWFAEMRGAPTASAASARVHQFQCQLAESGAVFEKFQNVETKTTEVNGRTIDYFTPAVDGQDEIIVDPTNNPQHVNIRVWDTSVFQKIVEGLVFTVREPNSSRDAFRARVVDTTPSEDGNSVMCKCVFVEWLLEIREEVVKGSLAVAYAMEEIPGPIRFANLYQRGFRHIPPWGFLPVDDSEADSMFGDGLVQQRWLDTGAFEGALQQAESYFEGTNVLTYRTVAIHDDDILEDMVRSIDKDPIVLRPWVRPAREDVKGLIERIAVGLEGTYGHTAAGNLKLVGNSGANQLIQYVLLGVLVRVIGHGGATIEQIINREVEVVQLIVPMDARDRWRPNLDGVETQEVVGLRTLESVEMHETLAGERANYLGRLNLGRYNHLFGDILRPNSSSKPHRFVFYVKQRLVLLDLVFKVIEPALAVITYVPLLGQLDSTEVAKIPKSMRTREFINAFTAVAHRDPTISYIPIELVQGRKPEPGLDRMGEILAQPLLRNAILEYSVERWPELRSAEVWEDFAKSRKESVEAWTEKGMLPEDAERHGLYDAIERMLDEYPGFGLIKLTAVSVSPPVFEELVGAMGEIATKERAAGVETTPLGREVFAERPEPRGDAGASAFRGLYEVARRWFGRRPIHEFVDTDLPLTLNDVLIRPASDFRERLGAPNRTKLTRQLKKDGAKLVETVKKIAEQPQPASKEFKEAFLKVLSENAENLNDAFKAAKAALPDGDKGFVDLLRDIHRLVGDNGFSPVLSKMWRV